MNLDIILGIFLAVVAAIGIIAFGYLAKEKGEK